MRKRGRIITLAVVLIVAAAVIILLRNGKKDDASALSPERRTAEAYESTYTRVIDISGYVEPYDSQTMRFRSTGAVTGVFVDEGDHVTEGQLLASIDNTSQLASLQEIRDQIEEAELSGSRRELELLRLRETAAEKSLEYTDIVAPFDGEVASRDVDAGDYFEGGDEVMTIVDRSRLKATVEVDEIDMPYVYEGQTARIIFEAYPEYTIEAVVDYIPMLGRYSDQGIGVVDVELLIEDPPEGIIPGFTFEGTLESETETTILLIPHSSIIRERGGKESVNIVEKDGSITSREVRTEYLGEGLSEVLEGDVHAGDTLLLGSSSSGRSPAGPPPGGPR